MKTKLLLSALLSFSFCLLSSQVPLGFNYQAIARNANGVPIASQSIPVRISIVTALTGGTVMWQEEFSSVTTDAYGLISLVVGNGTHTGGSATSFSAIDWSAQTLFLKIEIKYPGTATTWTDMGTSQIWSVPYSLLAKNIAPLSKLGITGTTDDMEDALFEVKNKTGQTVFAVYNEGIRAYVGNGDAKSKRGGFAVGGYDMTKGTNDNYMNVNADASEIIDPSQNRILWYPIKNAFLTGKVLVETPDSVGTNSFASGFESKAEGQYSQALGYKAIARGDYSTAIGKNSIVNGSNSYAFGEGVYVKGQNSYVLGKGSRAIGNGAYAFGENSVSSNPGSFALGTNCTVSGFYSLATGYNAAATGNFSFSLGYETNNSGDASSAIGYQTSVSGTYALAIGYQSNASYYNAIAIGAGDTASSDGSLAIGRFNKSTNFYSVSIGVSNISTGIGSTSIGMFNHATGLNALALGNQSFASGHNGIAIGNAASSEALQSVSIGTNSITKGDLSTAIGFGIVSKPFASVAVGEYNDTSICFNSLDDDSRDPIFMVGNGLYYSRRNALTVFKNGYIGIGTTNATQLLDVNGNARFRGVASGTFGNNLNIMADGTLTTATSDISMKENIDQISDALERVIKLRGVFFNWKNDSTKIKQIGMIAQEVEPVVPEIVFTNPVDGLKGINYSQASALFVEAIKEQQKRITGQQQQIESQQKEIDELKTLINSLIANQTAQVNKY
jgi:Hep_Hag.